MSATDTEPTTDTEPETQDRACDLCGETGTTYELPLHGECLLRQAFGGIGEILVPGGDPDGGMTPRQSGFAVEVLINETRADVVLRRTFTGTPEDRRGSLAYLRAAIAEDYAELDELDPEGAKLLRAKKVIKKMMGQLRDVVHPDDDDRPPAEA